MIKAILVDFSRTLLFPKNKLYNGGLNALHTKLKEDPNYNFLDHFELNSELLNYLDLIKHKFILCLLTTETIQEAPEIKGDLDKVFSKVYSSIKIGLYKKDPQVYLYIAKDLSLAPEELFFIDDTQENISAANQAGVAVQVYTNNEAVISKLKTL